MSLNIGILQFLPLYLIFDNKSSLIANCRQLDEVETGVLLVTGVVGSVHQPLLFSVVPWKALLPNLDNELRICCSLKILYAN